MKRRYMPAPYLCDARCGSECATQTCRSRAGTIGFLSAVGTCYRKEVVLFKLHTTLSLPTAVVNYGT